jgi:hypothetical protein
MRYAQHAHALGLLRQIPLPLLSNNRNLTLNHSHARLSGPTKFTLCPAAFALRPEKFALRPAPPTMFCTEAKQSAPLAPVIPFDSAPLAPVPVDSMQQINYALTAPSALPA